MFVVSNAQCNVSITLLFKAKVRKSKKNNKTKGHTYSTLPKVSLSKLKQAIFFFHFTTMCYIFLFCFTFFILFYFYILSYLFFLHCLAENWGGHGPPSPPVGVAPDTARESQMFHHEMFFKIFQMSPRTFEQFLG